ncbi:MAG: hypothetical protein ACLFST_00180 [Spirochaetia bacterium]
MKPSISEITDRLKYISKQNLYYREDFPDAASRWEAWWNFQSDRHLLVAALPNEKNIRRDKCFDLLENPEEWLALRKRQLENTYFLDQTIPGIRVDLGPVATGAFLGAPLHFAGEEQTSWQNPVWDRLADAEPPVLEQDNKWYRLTRKLCDLTASDARGSYVVVLPDLGGAADILANLRGAEGLLLDLYDNPEKVLKLQEALVDRWESVFFDLYGRITEKGTGVVCWHQAWSEKPYTVPSCDFNYMVGPEHFKELILPSLRDQAKRAGRCSYHLDGPGASVHAESLAGAEEIDVIQYTPGAGTPSAMAKIEMYKMIQERGKPVIVMSPAEEVPQLVKELDPRGTVIFPEGLKSRSEADELLEMVKSK